MLQSFLKDSSLKQPICLTSLLRFSTSLPRFGSNRPASTMAHIPSAVVVVKGPHTDAPDLESHLQQKLQSISKNVTHLLIDKDTPSNVEWAILGAHFNNVEDLELESGFNEELNDRNIPLHWPLKRLALSSAGGELVQSPFIRQGTIHHLKLNFTCNLRFEGPTSDELRKAHTKKPLTGGRRR